MSESEKVSPVRQQYLQIKRQYPDTILFFRLGDFYETFDGDAEITSRELDIVLTSRNVAKGVRVPMAGIPHHAADGYLSKLIEKGYHVAICEQVGDGPVRGLFPRKVVRVLTPGTVVEAGLLPGDLSNYLSAVVVEGDRIGIAYADVSTGEFAATEFDASSPMLGARQELMRLQPAEILLPESLALEEEGLENFTRLPDWRFEVDRAVERLLEHFGTATLAGFGLAEMTQAVRAAGVIVDYLMETQQPALRLLNQISTYTLSDFMVLDAATRRNLELTETLRTGEIRGSLLGVLDTTVSPMGKRLLRQWIGKPLVDIEAINRRLDQVEALHGDGIWRAEIRQKLSRLGDLERLSNRIAAGVAGPRDLVGLRLSLQRLPALIELVDSREASALERIRTSLDPNDAVRQLLERSIADDPPATLAHTGIIRAGYSEELDSILDSSREAREWISSLEKAERERTGIKTLKVGFNKVFGYYIEVTKANAELVPSEYIRKQTLVNAERYITPEMKEYESRVLTAEEQIRKIEGDLFREVCRQIGELSPKLVETARALARLDVVAGLAEVATLKGYRRPQVVEEDVLDIRGSRHPVVEEFLVGKRFVPNDALLEEGERVRVITGPNMSGKSTYLRQVALVVLMAQMGSFVPAEQALIGMTDRIFTRIGAQDEIHAGQSTFMVEMIETANILHHATRRSLIILDEVGRGTSTYDGVSIAWAVVEYLHNHPRLRARTLFATHYHELTQLAEMLPGVRNYNVAVSEEGGEVVFLYKIVPGGADKSYGIHVAELAGLPRSVINRAQAILSQLETESRSAWSSGKPTPWQLKLFPLTNPMLDELRALDPDSLTPLEALNKLFQWRQQFLAEEEDHPGT